MCDVSLTKSRDSQSVTITVITGKLNVLNVLYFDKYVLFSIANLIS